MGRAHNNTHRSAAIEVSTLMLIMKRNSGVKDIPDNIMDILARRGCCHTNGPQWHRRGQREAETTGAYQLKSVRVLKPRRIKENAELSLLNR